MFIGEDLKYLRMNSDSDLMCLIGVSHLVDICKHF